MPLRPFLPLLACLLLPPFAQAEVRERARLLRFGFVVENPTPAPVPGAVLWVRAPVRRTSTQECRDISASHPFELSRDGWENQTLRFDLGTFPPFAAKEVRVKASLVVRDLPVKRRASRRELQACLCPEPFVQSDAPALAGLAASLRGKNPSITAREVSRWIASHLRYEGPRREPLGALEAYLRGKGDCTEAMHLFAALCRAAGVPARRVGGYVWEEGRPHRPEDSHDWAEYYDRGRWLVTDPQRTGAQPLPGDYIAFNVMEDAGGFQRFRIAGDGLQVRMMGGEATP